MTSSTTRSKADSEREEPLEGSFAGVDDLGRVTLGFEIEAEAFRQVLFVFNDQHALRGTGHARDTFGSQSVNVLPRPGPSLSANALPPCLLATDLTMKRPRPLPFARIATLAGTR